MEQKLKINVTFRQQTLEEEQKFNNSLALLIEEMVKKQMDRLRIIPISQHSTTDINQSTSASTPTPGGRPEVSNERPT